MKIKLLVPFDGGFGTIWAPGCTLEVDDAAARSLIEEGTAVRMPDDTPARLDPAGYVGCNPPSEAELLALRGAVGPEPNAGAIEGQTPKDQNPENATTKRPAKA